jgi:DNA-binding transcriptional regulator YdaS (Cro superfamily)
MDLSLVDPGVIRPWLICEAGGRWLTAVRRFGAEIVPPELVPNIESAERDQVLAKLARPVPSIVLWETRRESLALSCDSLARTADLNPRTLQIVACHQISHRERLCLTPYPVSAMVEHPEDLTRLTRMIHLHFARWTQVID